MGWVLLAGGVVLLVIGFIFRFLVLKKKSSGNIKGEPVDIYQDYSASERGRKKKFRTGVDRTVSSKYRRQQNTNSRTSKSREAREEKRLVKNQQNLAEINDELEELIAEINEREKILKEKVQGIDSSLLESSTAASFDKTFDRKFKDVQERALPEHYKQVINFHDQGLEIENIAERLNLGVRETELIVKMHGNGADANAG